MSKTSELETKMADVFVNKAPKMPKGGQKAIVDWAPWLALILGVLSLLSAWSLWHWAHFADNAANYANSICSAYASYAPNSCAAISSSTRLSFWIWLSMAVIAVEGVLYLLAFSGLRDRKKQGWNYLFYGALVNVAYAVVSLFNGYDAAGHFIGAVIGSAIGFWILFQIRSAYTGHVDAKHDTPQTPVA